jgi:hypothetical protein
VQEGAEITRISRISRIACATLRYSSQPAVRMSSRHPAASSSRRNRSPLSFILHYTTADHSAAIQWIYPQSSGR